jgi:hypothetical protein
MPARATGKTKAAAVCGRTIRYMAASEEMNDLIRGGFARRRPAMSDREVAAVREDVDARLTRPPAGDGGAREHSAPVRRATGMNALIRGAAASAAERPHRGIIFAGDVKQLHVRKENDQ